MSLAARGRRGLAIGVLSACLVAGSVVASVAVASSGLAGLAVAVLLVGCIGVSVVALSSRDATAVLTLVMVLVFLLPEPLVLDGPLRSAGNPALLVSMWALVAWAAGRVLNTVVPRPNHPLRWVILCYVLVAATALAAALMRPLTPDEISGSSRSPFAILAAVGIVLLACDAITDRARLDTLLYRTVLVGGIAAAIGVMEFVFKGFDYQSLVHVPGLTTHVDIINDTRSDFVRVDGAAAHPIEYAVALAALVPLGLHFLSYAPTRRARQAAGLATFMLLAVLPMSVSRSAILAVVVGIAFYFVHWTGRTRINAIIIGVIGLGFFRAAVPGLLGTLKSLFLVGSKDPSIAGRTEDYAQIPGLMQGHWIFGRGLGTFQPAQYFYLDNQFLGSLLEGGVLALVVLVSLFVVGMSLARGARHRSRDVSTRSLGQAIAGCLASLLISCITFDEFSFRQTLFLVFLLCGCAGALWSMTRAQQEAERAEVSVEGRELAGIP